MHRIVATAVAWVLLVATAGAQSPGSTGIYRVGTRLRRLWIHPPFAAAVTVILRYGVGVDRYGSFAVCTPTSSGLRCR